MVSQYFTDFPLKFMKVDGFSKIKVLPLNLNFAIEPNFSVSKLVSSFEVNSSKTSKPILCLVWSYFSPIFPSPTIKYFFIELIVDFSLLELKNNLMSLDRYIKQK